MRVVLDTNVFISGIFFNGHLSQILEAWKKGSFQAYFFVKFGFNGCLVPLLPVTSPFD